MDLNTESKDYSRKLKALPGQYSFWLVILTMVVTFYILVVQVRIGVPYWDVFNYLNNALYMAGLEGPGAGTISLSPSTLLNLHLLPTGTGVFHSDHDLDAILFIISCRTLLPL